MLKNRFFASFAFAGLLGLAACGGGEDAAVTEEPVLEETAPVVEPAPAPTTMPMDTAGGMQMDTSAGMDTAAVGGL